MKPPWSSFLVLKLLHVSPIWNEIFTNKPFLFFRGNHSLLNMQTLALVCPCPPHMTGSPLLEWFITRPARLVRFALPFQNHTGEMFLSFARGRAEWTESDFCTGTRVYFLILCNEDQILSLLAEWSGEEYLVPCVCMFIHFFFFNHVCFYFSPPVNWRAIFPFACSHIVHPLKCASLI